MMKAFGFFRTILCAVLVMFAALILPGTAQAASWETRNCPNCGWGMKVAEEWHSYFGDYYSVPLVTSHNNGEHTISYECTNSSCKYYSDYYLNVTDSCQYGSLEVEGYKQKDDDTHVPYGYVECLACSYKVANVEGTPVEHRWYKNIYALTDEGFDSKEHWDICEASCADCGRTSYIRDFIQEHSLHVTKSRYTYLGNGKHQVENYLECYDCDYGYWKKGKTVNCSQTNKKVTYKEKDNGGHMIRTVADISCGDCKHSEKGCLISNVYEKHTLKGNTVKKYNSTGHWKETTYKCTKCSYVDPTISKSTVTKHNLTTGDSDKTYKKNTKKKHTIITKYHCSGCNYTTTKKTTAKHKVYDTYCWNVYQNDSKHRTFTTKYCICDYVVKTESRDYSHTNEWKGSTAVGGTLKYMCRYCNHVFATESSFAKNFKIYRDETTKKFTFDVSKYDKVSSIHITWGSSLKIIKTGSNYFTVKPLRRNSSSEVTVKLKSGITYQYMIEMP